MLDCLSDFSCVHHQVPGHGRAFDPPNYESNEGDDLQRAFIRPVISPHATLRNIQGRLLLHILLVMKGLQERPLDARDREAVDEPLPPPIISNNWPSLSDRCFVADLLKRVGILCRCWCHY